MCLVEIRNGMRGGIESMDTDNNIKQIKLQKLIIKIIYI